MACYLFRTGSGALVDSSSNGRNGTLGGASAWEAISGTGKPIYATYQVSANAVSVDDAIDTGFRMGALGAFSVSTWAISTANETRSPGGNNDLVLSGNDYCGIDVFFLGSSGVWARSRINGADVTITASSWSTNQWYHLVATYDGSTFELYQNGTRVAFQASLSGNIYNSLANYKIMRRGDNLLDNNIYNLKGAVSETAIFSRGLSSTEINDIMTNGLSPSASPSVGSILNNSVWNDTVFK